MGGFKEWVDGWAEGKTKGFIKTKSLGWMAGWVGGFAKVDNRFGYEKWLQGGSAVLALL